MTKSFSKQIKKRMVKTLVWPVAMYACETWILKKEEMDRLEAFEMWIWRRIKKVSWEDKKTNEQVLSNVGEERQFLSAVVKRKKNWIGHVVRGESLLKLVLEGRMEERKRETEIGND
jgi:hypothetical protein